MKEINYDNIEKISDTLIYLDDKAQFKMNTKLARKDTDGFRLPFANGYNIGSQKYAGFNELISIKRNFDSYFSIEVVGDSNFFIMIRPNIVFLVAERLEWVIKNWLLKLHLIY